MNTIRVSQRLAAEAKLAAQTVQKSLTYLVREGFAEVEYNTEWPKDILRAVITVLPPESEQIEIE